MRNKVFIASSEEKKEYAETIARIIEDQKDCPFKPLTWYNRAFKPNENYLAELTRIGKSIQGVIIILTKDDEVRRIRGDVSIKPRDNLVFECGLFFGMCGPRRTLIVLEEGTQLPSDLQGINFILYRNEHNLKYDISDWCLKLKSSNEKDFPLNGRWIYYLRCENFNAYGRFDVENNRGEVEMVNGCAYYAQGPADSTNLRGTWHSEMVIINKEGDFKAIYRMNILKMPEKEKKLEHYTGAFILHAIQQKPLHGILKGRFSYLTEEDPCQGEIHACKIGELGDYVDERDSKLPQLISERIFRSFERRKAERRICERRKYDIRSQGNQTLVQHP